MGGAPHRVLYFWHSVGNKLLTLFSNCLTDTETCYKAFPREELPAIPTGGRPASGSSLRSQ
jgi:hypothetical protein